MKRCIECNKIQSEEDTKIYEEQYIFENGRFTGKRGNVCIGEGCIDCGAVVVDA